MENLFSFYVQKNIIAQQNIPINRDILLKNPYNKGVFSSLKNSTFVFLHKT